MEPTPSPSARPASGVRFAGDGATERQREMERLRKEMEQKREEWHQQAEKADGRRQFEEWNATKIQAAYRGMFLRRHQSRRHEAATTLQRYYRKRLSTRSHDRSAENYLNENARCIQRIWRRFSSVRIYRYYRDLIRFKEAGDPRNFLKSINPREMELLDAAAGTFVRFRLGGVSFPPLIYYKIFTHRTVQDVNSYAPRDYAHEYEPRNVMAAENNSTQYGTRPGQAASWDVEGWYKRVENNGWRPVSERILLQEDPIATLTASRKLDFHHLATKRREDKELMRRKKKREWLMRMYREARGGADGAAAAAADDELEHEGDEDLLSWSMGLDFDAYMSEWSALATSHPSDMYVPEDIYTDYARLSVLSHDELVHYDPVLEGGVYPGHWVPDGAPSPAADVGSVS